MEADGTVIPGFLVNFLFHNDGTLTYSSSSKIDHRGFNDRGGALANWEDLGGDLYHWQSVELMYAYPPPPADTTTPNFAGTFYVDGTFLFDPVADTLCAGRPTECPDQKIHVFICTGLDTSNCIAAEANTFCQRLSARFPALP